MPQFRRTDLNAYSALNEFRVDEKFHDIVVNIGRRSFPCHRIILASSLTYFQKLLHDNYVGEDKKNEVELKHTNADAFEYLLRYIYGKPILVVEENVLGLLEISHYLGPRCLQDSCTRYAADNHLSFSLDSVLDLFAFASKSANVVLVEALTEWVAENFGWMSKRAKFCLVCVSDLLGVLTHPSLITNLTAQSDFLLNWIKMNFEEGSEPELSRLLNAMIGF